MQRSHRGRSQEKVILRQAQDGPIFYCIDKAPGVTTREAVKKLLQVKGRGFGVEGILDPFASGLLITATGPSTRFLSYFLALHKTYVAQITLGAETDTLDTDGDVIRRQPVPSLNTQLLANTALRFTGQIEQVPPLYSNLKVDGRRGHEIAREGGTVDMRPRQVQVHALSLAMDFHNQAMEKQSHIMMQCTVSSGTYIRTLARDIAVALGTCGYLSALRRVSIGHFSAGENPPNHPAGLTLSEMSDFEALSFFEVVQLSEAEAKKFLNGMPLLGVEKADAIYRICCREKFFGLGRVAAQTLRVEKIYSTAP